ncbi:acyltransferase [Planococcus halocryophilus]|uniref:acyltransferase n=1 Tax=Planococcus halocryophilus TaxID=1215089 RepID=UPI001F0FB9F9|nr:acyltransferase family protein [Planococcus halocryophilus]MCH4826812.1 acyltransferase family protein [Planococcus halocryophilus]
MTRRYDYMDWLRAISIFVVVGIHVVSKIINNTTTDDWIWHFANIFDAGLRWCVPVFFMLSGALLLTRGKEESVLIFLKKRLSKVVIPLIFWSIIYTLYNIFELEESYTAYEIFVQFLTDDIYYHLWFLYTITGLYLMAPFLKLLVQHMDKKTFQALLVFWIIFSSFLPFLPKFFDFEVAFSAGLFEPYIGYFLLGAYLVLYPVPKKYLPTLGTLALISYILTVWGTYYLNMAQPVGEFDEFFYEHYRPNNLLITLFIFIGFQHMANKIKPNAWITRISTATFGIYIIHPIIQIYLNKFFGLNETTFNPIVSVPLVWILIFSISFGIILVMQKLPIINRLVP